MAQPGTSAARLAEDAGMSAARQSPPGAPSEAPRPLDCPTSSPGARSRPEHGASRAEGRPQSRDEAAFRGLYEATARPIWAYLYRTLGDAADADDLVQEVFLRYLKAPLETRDLSENRAYLFRIASNLAIDHWRRGERRAARSGSAADAERVAAPDQADAVALRADMAKTFRALKPRERTLLWLSCVEGESPAAIAAALGLGRNSVPVLLFRARRKLARLLERAGWEG